MVLLVKHPRNIILARRAAFLGQALWLAGCPPTRAEPAEPTAAPAPVPIAHDAPEPSAPEPRASAKPIAPLPIVEPITPPDPELEPVQAGPIDGDPTLDPPKGAPPELVPHYWKLKADVLGFRARLDKLAANVKRVSQLSRGGAREAFVEAAGVETAKLQGEIRWVRHTCKSSDPDRQAFELRGNNEHEKLEKRIIAIEAAWKKALSEELYDGPYTTGLMSQPQVCLSFACSDFW